MKTFIGYLRLDMESNNVIDHKNIYIKIKIPFKKSNIDNYHAYMISS